MVEVLLCGREGKGGRSRDQCGPIGEGRGGKGKRERERERTNVSAVVLVASELVVTGAEVDVTDVADADEEAGALLEITVEEAAVVEVIKEEVEVVLGTAEEVLSDCEEAE